METNQTLIARSGARSPGWKLPAIPLAPFVVLALVLALAGTGVGAYLAYENLQGQAGVCTIAHSCAKVQKSSYGKLMGVPVSVFGLGLYALLAAAAVAWLRNIRELRPVVTFFAFNGALFGFLFSGYLTYVEAFVLDAWCIYCIISASLMTGLFATWAGVLWLVARDRRPG